MFGLVKEWVSINLASSFLKKYVWIPFAIHFVVYWSGSGLAALADRYFEKNDLLEKYKIQGDLLKRSGGFDWSKYYRNSLICLKNQLLVTIPTMILIVPIFREILLTNLGLIDWIESTAVKLSINDLWIWIVLSIIQLFMAYMLESACFYYVHRMLHRPWWYKRVHKIHHEWRAPVAVRALYSHPFEHFAGNVLPVIVIPCLLGMNIYLIYLWITIGTINSLVAHSGFKSITADSHDEHHKYFNCNYGLGEEGFDWFHSTRLIDKKRILQTDKN
tara:strand:+ start:639 stop:1460 length:822 start_codon:yes stop_codon:yes gene_type:complete